MRSSQRAGSTSSTPSDGTVTSIGPAYIGFEFAWRPPEGRQLLFVGDGATGPALLLYAVDTGHVEEVPITLPDGQDEIRLAGWTADGTRFAYLVETAVAG